MNRRAEPILRALALSKSFGDVHANVDVDLELWAGAVHALVGENGAGKSTLLKMIYGVYRPDSGQLMVDGREAEISGPAAARRFGIGMVFQDLRLVPALTVAENIALAMPGGVLVKERALRRRVAEASETFGLAVDPAATVAHLSIGERQRVEILKVLMTGARLIILDEPTSVLAPQEVQALFATLEQLRERGIGVVIVTHKIDEIRMVADRATVLRGGRVILGNVDPAAYSDEELVEAMVGHAVADLKREPAMRSSAEGSPALELSAITSLGDRGHKAVKEVSLAVGRGELVGIAGVAGSGQRELCEVALGLRAALAGTVMIDGRAVNNALDALAAGVSSVPEDPVADSVVGSLSVLHHMVLDGRRIPSRVFGIDWGNVKRAAAERDRKSGLRMAGVARKVSELSGGNIQRVILTRELSLDSVLVVAAYPSRGLDIANVRRTQELLIAQRDRGAGVLMVSEDLDELMSIADRIVVMHDGHISGEVLPNQFDRAGIGRLMLGGAA
jgi:simple sugar transport system ATP-binding protein